MRALDQCASFVVTRSRAPVGELTPPGGRRPRFVAAEVVMGMLSGAPVIDSVQFRADVDTRWGGLPSAHPERMLVDESTT